MSHSLSRRQAAVLGFVVLVALGLGAYGLARVADKQGLWADSVEVTVGFPEAHDLAPGIPVRVRGVDAGQVIAIEYPDDDQPGAEVTVRMKVQSRYASRLYANASAQVFTSGVFGSKVVAIQPGDPARGPLTTGRLRGTKSSGIDEAVAEVRDLAGEAKKLAADVRETSAAARGLIADVRTSKGTAGKLLQDDELYRDMKGIAADTRGLIKRADQAVGAVDTGVADLKGFVSDGRETLRSVKQGTDALARLPVVRGYVEDAAALLVRPTHRHDRRVYNVVDLFESRSAILTPGGRTHLANATVWLRQAASPQTEVVVVAFSSPTDTDHTPASARELTKAQSEAVVEFFKGQGVHKMGWWKSSRKLTPLGMGMSPSPVVEKAPLPPSNVQIQLFTPP